MFCIVSLSLSLSIPCLGTEIIQSTRFKPHPDHCASSISSRFTFCASATRMASVDAPQEAEAAGEDLVLLGAIVQPLKGEINGHGQQKMGGGG